ncbi:MAG TPA: ribonuclease H-like domain-containing protein [Candidatus Paceibacterota bacterium]|nr:ribonuclease H-like domain-containing protein [Candidatus Paceibacterota bacterium]HRZ34512.1 ribonuclease H-like domain-containing protein [Candidatus Paceibacterota bacterium]
MNYIVFDVETKNTFSEVESNDPRDLDISVVSVYEKDSDTVKSFLEQDFHEMWPIFERADIIVGYNSEHFDIPLLNKYYSGDLSRFKGVDLMASIKKNLGRRPKLDNVAAGTLGRNKIAEGLNAVEWWKQGKIDQIKKYCEEDVLITKEIFEYALKNKKVLVKDKFSDNVIEVPIDTSEWKKSTDTPKSTKSLF